MRRSDLGQLTTPDAFFWATGIEDTFITAPHVKTGRTLDEYELTGHYERWREDLDLMKSLGIRIARYGIPWHRINPARDKWDWEWTDAALNYALELGIDPIVDLVHYGLPTWIEGAYFNPEFPEYMAEYAGQVAARYKGRIHFYTPLNEPRITAWYCGKLGWWPPFARGWSGFAKVMMSVCKGIVRTIQTFQEVDPEIVPVHVDATDLYETSDPALENEVRHRQEIVFLALDLISGRVKPGHALYDWLLARKIRSSDLAWFEENAVDLDLIGINMYPMFSKKVLRRSTHGLRTQMPYANGEIVTKLGHLYYQRYGAPLFISEIASVGSVKRRQAWLRESVLAVRQIREEGVPMVGYTWWPMFALVTWAYRQGEREPAYYLKQMGLWDIKATSADPLERVRTPLVSEFQALVSGGASTVGRLQYSEPGRQYAA